MLSCPKLTPLQTRFLASVATLALLGLIYWTLGHPPLAYAADLDFDGRGESRGGEDHNWHRIAQEALEGDGINDEVAGTSVLSARTPAVSSTGGNNVPNIDNIEAGNTTVWMFSREQLRSQHAKKGPGLPPFEDPITEAKVQHGELRKRDAEGEPDEFQALQGRQDGQTRKIHISINTCLQPDYAGSGTQSAAPPQLTLYVATDPSNKNPGPQSNSNDQMVVVLDEGYANTTIQVNGDSYMSVHAPSLGNNFTGVWNYELAVSIDGFYHSVSDDFELEPNLFLLDSDSFAALLVTDNLTQADPSQQSYKDWMNLTAPYIVFASNINDSRTLGLSKSFCGLNMNSQIAGKQEQSDGEGTNVQMQMTTRGLGNKPKEQFYVTALNRSSIYNATLAQVGNSTNFGSGVVGGGGKVWRSVTFPTKSDGNCALLYNLDFCSEVAYAVPSTPDLVANYSGFQSLYDNYTLNYYHNFNYSLQQIPCHTTSDAQYSLARNCQDCAKAYKDWICAVSIPRCTDFSSGLPWLQSRNMGQPFLNGSQLSSSVLNNGYVPMSGAPTLEGTVAFSQTYISSMATNSSRNPMIDDVIKPGPYKEVLPCEDLCYGLMQSCPAALGFGCPFPGKGLEASYGSRHGNSNGNLTCSFLGAYVYTGGVAHVGSDVLRACVVAATAAIMLVGL